MINVEELPTCVDHSAQSSLALKAKPLVQRDRSGVVRVDAGEALWIAQLLEVILENDEDGFCGVAASAVLARDVQTVAEDAEAMVAVVRGYLSDDCAGRIFDDPRECVVLQFPERRRL